MIGATIRQLISIDARNHCVLDAKLFDRFAHVTRLVRVEISRATLADCTEPAMSSANVTKNHECRGAFSPALEDVRASSFLTNGVQAQVLDQFIDTIESFIRANPHLEPIRSWSLEFGFSHVYLRGRPPASSFLAVLKLSS